TDTLTLGGNSFISGAASLSKFGAGTLELGGTSGNLYTGGTFVNEGTLLLNKQDTAGRPFQPNATGLGSVTVGNEIGGAGADVLRYGSSAGVDQIYGLSTVTVTTSGLLDLATNNKSDFINALTLERGRLSSADVETGSGTLTVVADITATTPTSVFGVP